jgi:predicted nucleic acid-binding Zn ribbon protein
MEERGLAKPLGELLGELLKEYGAKRRDEHRALTEAWSRAAGPEVARRTRVVGLTRDTLTVSVESAALRQELESFRRDDVLARLREEFPARRIARVRCVLKG